MNKLLPYTTISALFLFVITSLLPCQLMAQDSAPSNALSSLESIDGLYKEVPELEVSNTADEIEVVEFFWYGCPHCYKLEPLIEEWLDNKADYIKFVRIPGVLSPQWIEHARAFYIAEQLGVIDQIHAPLFTAINKDREKINDESSLRKFFVKQGVNKKDFDQAYQSQDVQLKIRKAFAIAKHYKLTAVPTMIVAGKYLTSASMAGSNKKILEIADILAADEYQKRSSP